MLLTMGLLCAVHASDSDAPASEIPEGMEVTPQVRFRVKSFARESDPIVNPIHWAQFRDYTEEGTRVQKGDQVFHLDMTRTEQALDQMENDLKEVQNDVEQRLAGMQKSLSELEDRRSEKQDALAIQKARYRYLKALPLAEEVAIAEGRFHVAHQRLEAEAEDLKTNRRRLEENLISPALVEESDQTYRMQQARTEYAKTMLRLERLPAHSDTLKVVEFRIENLNLEIDKLAAEIALQEKIVAIEQSTQQRRVEETESRLAERRLELDHEFLYAPSDGVLLYTPQFKRELASGGKASIGMTIAEIPRQSSLALEGQLPEQQRHFFKPGDPVEITLNQYPGQTFEGSLLTISPFSKDARDDADESSGVKIVDVEVEILNPPDPFPLGVYGWATLSTLKPVRGVAVPVSWVRYRSGKPHLSLNGLFEEVRGLVSGPHFLLTPPHPEPASIQQSGTWVEEGPALPLTDDQFIATGELLPSESISVETPDIRAWDIQIAWLYPENSFIEKGETVIKLSSERIQNNVDSRANEEQRVQGERKSAEEQLEITKQERDFQISAAENRLAITQLERDLVHKGASSSAIAQADLDLRSAEIQLEKATSRLERVLRNPDWSAPAERKRLERDQERRRLEKERAGIQRKQALEGPTKLERSLADLDVLRETANTRDITAQQNRSLTRAQSHLRWRIRNERRARERLERYRNDLEALNIKAPTSGLVKYARIWDGVRHSKIKTGMRVWRGSQLLSLSNTRDLYVEISVPERYIHHLRLDMPVSAHIPSSGGLQWSGRVSRMSTILEPARISSTPTSLYANQEVTQEQVLNVRIDIEADEDSNLKPGAIAHIIFPFSK
ncbi:MAG: efflux RND transporter periplasmic adaptor subunit [Kiritimatiellae bacterium]|nr:efflux RND transporter periplasmic adaptor subunit [Kiritimatiellia bacterium]